MMKVFKDLFIVLIILSGVVLINGCEQSGSLTGTGVIKGNVKDSTLLSNLKGAIVTTSPVTYEVTTDSLGNFMITGVTGGDYVVTISKPFYYAKSVTVTAVDADTIKPMFKILFTNIFYAKDSLAEYFNDNSFSAMDLLNLRTIMENQNTIKDIQMRDSAGTSGNFYLRSGDLALRLAGLETRFTPPLTKSNGDSLYTETEFYNLNKIKLSGTISTSDFYLDRTGYFSPLGNLNKGMGKVYGFWLKTRSNPSKNLYGMIYLNSAKMEGGIYYLRVNAKVNWNGVDLFGPNQ